MTHGLGGFFPTPKVPLSSSTSPPLKPFLANVWTMSDSQEQLWSDNPNAPNIPPTTYFAEKAYFAGILVSSVLYGTPKAPHTRPSIRAHFVRSDRPRNYNHAILTMYGRVI